MAEELCNIMGSFLIPGWEESRPLKQSLNRTVSLNPRVTRNKIRGDAFKTDIRIISQSDSRERRRSIIRAIASGFDPLEGDNKLVENKIEGIHLKHELNNVNCRKLGTLRDVLCSNELSKMINVPDQKLQLEHYNDIALVSHRGISEVPKEIFVDDGGIPFMNYEDTDGTQRTVYFSASNPNLLCMSRVIIGEPGSGKTTFGINFSLDAFLRGYSVFAIDASDGKMVQRILNFVPPEKRDKVKIIDMLDPKRAIGLGWNEAFIGDNADIVEDLLVEEVITYIELVAGVELNMTAKQWVENAVKAVFNTPDATLQDVENMINNAEYRNSVIPSIKDPELRKDWEYYHEIMKPEERKGIYDQIYRRLAQVIRKKP
jgi:hypothetical protein